MQTQLTNSLVQVQIAESQGEAELARARKQAEQTVVTAEAELARSRRQAEQTVVLAEADTPASRMLAGRGEGQQIMQVGLSEAAVLMRKIARLRRPAAVRRIARGRTPRRQASRSCRSGCSSMGRTAIAAPSPAALWGCS